MKNLFKFAASVFVAIYGLVGCSQQLPVIQHVTAAPAKADVGIDSRKTEVQPSRASTTPSVTPIETVKSPSAQPVVISDDGRSASIRSLKLDAALKTPILITETNRYPDQKTNLEKVDAQDVLLYKIFTFDGKDYSYGVHLALGTEFELRDTQARDKIVDFYKALGFSQVTEQKDADANGYIYIHHRNILDRFKDVEFPIMETVVIHGDLITSPTYIRSADEYPASGALPAKEMQLKVEGVDIYSYHSNDGQELVVVANNHTAKIFDARVTGYISGQDNANLFQSKILRDGEEFVLSASVQRFESNSSANIEYTGAVELKPGATVFHYSDLDLTNQRQSYKWLSVLPR